MFCEDSLTKQVEEIEALAAIYEDDLKVINESKRQYEIKITNNKEDSQHYVILQIILPDDYPTSSPPEYQLQAVWLRGEERRKLNNSLEDIFVDNLGDSVLYLWIEKIREFLQEYCEDNKESVCSKTEDGKEEKVEGAFAMTDLQEGIDEFQYDYSNYKSDKTASENVTAQKCPHILHGELVHDRKSTFQAHLAPVISEAEVRQVMEKLLENRKVAAATHNIQAYRICREGKKNAIWFQDCKDDGEIHAGNRILHLMEILEATNVLVVITRWYGGIHLGPDRFKHINNCARNILEQGGYIKNKTEKKGPKSGKKSR